MLKPADEFLKKYSKTPLNFVTTHKITFPKDFGLPYVHYASVTQKVGFDLYSLCGQTLDLEEWNLFEKKNGSNLRAFVVIKDQKAICGWLAEAKSAPGGGVYPLSASFDKK